MSKSTIYVLFFRRTTIMNEEFITEAITNDRYLKAIQLIEQFEDEIGAERTRRRGEPGRNGTTDSRESTASLRAGDGHRTGRHRLLPRFRGRVRSLPLIERRLSVARIGIGPASRSGRDVDYDSDDFGGLESRG